MKWRRKRHPSAEAAEARENAEHAAEEITAELVRQRRELARARPVLAELRRHNEANRYDHMIWNTVMKNSR